MDIHDYLGVLRRGAVLIVVGILLGLAGGFVAQSMERPSYSATSRELLTNKVAGDLSISQGRIASYVLVASSGLVLQPVIDELGLDTSVEDLARHVTVVAPPATVVIEITATDATPEGARDIANAISAHFGEVVADQLETTTGVTPTAAATPTPGPDGEVAPAPKPSPSVTRLPNGTVVPITPPTAPVRVVNLEQAALPTQPDPSNGPLMLLVGGVLGLALGLLAASLRESVDRRVRGPRDVARVTDVPVVGAIVSDRRIRSTLTARAGSRSTSAESFRALRAHIDHLRTRDGRRMFVLTAAGRGQGTTTVAANLAIAIANTGTTVVVVDADLRRPELSSLFDIRDSRGLSELLAGRVELDAVLRGVGTPGLTVLPSGAAAVNAGELLATARMRTLLTELAERFEMVIFDTPTIASASDAAVLGALTGSTLLVVAQGDTTRPRLDDALALLEAGGSEPIGIVLTRTRRTLAGRMPTAPGAPMHAMARPVAVAPAAPERAAEPVARPAEPVQAEAVRVEAVRVEAVRVEAPIAEVPTSVPGPAAAPVPAPSTAIVLRTESTRAPSHLSSPLPEGVEAEKPVRSAPRRVSAPVTSTAPAVSTPPAMSQVPVAPVPDVAEPESVRSPVARVPRRVTQPATHTAAAPTEDAAKPAAKPASKAPTAKPASAKSPVVPAVEKAAVEKSAIAKPATAKTPAVRKPATKPEPTPAAPAETSVPALEPAITSGEVVTEVAHTVGTARDLDFAFAALPTATAAEQRAGAVVPEIENSKPTPPAMVERPIVIRPDAPRPQSRFAPDPTRFSQRMSGAYASAPAPTAGTEGTRPEAQVTGTVVNTVSIRVQRDVIESATVPPPIRHILPRPGSTMPPKAVAAARPSAPEPEPELVELRPRTGPVPVPPLAREPLPVDEPVLMGEPVQVGDDGGEPETPGLETPDYPPGDGPTAETRAIPTIVGSLLGEIGGLPRVEVRAARSTAVTDTAPNPEREARESYEHRARQLERVAHERLMREQQRLAVDIREQLAHDKRELESVLDNRLEDTVLRPVLLSARRAADPRFSDPSDDDGDTR